MRPSSRILSALLPALLFIGISGSAAHAAGVKIQAGFWQIKTAITTPLIDRTTEDTTMKCLKRNPFTPERRAKQHKSCEIDKTVIADNEVSWKMVCETKIAKIVEFGSFKLEGDEGYGEAKTTMTVAGQAMVSAIVWKGRRLGECGMEFPKKPKKMTDKAAADALPTLPKPPSATSGD